MKERKGGFLKWIYEFKHGHPRLLSEESDIIIKLRFNKHLKFMTDNQIKKLIEVNIKDMYENKFPNSKKWKIF